MQVIATIAPSRADVEREEHFIHLYQEIFPSVATFIRKHGGSLSDAKDVFQDAVVIYYEKTVADESEIRNNSGYIFGIAKHLWFKKFTDEPTTVPSEFISDYFTDEMTPSIAENKLLKFLEVSGKRCLSLLTAFYYHQLPLKVLYHQMGFSSERSATVQKFKCVEKLRNVIKTKMLSHEDFLE